MPGWVTAFKAIPWRELITAAPVVARGARMLWESVRHQEAGAAAGQDPATRLKSLEAQVEELRSELTAASEVMATLAEQNARVVEVVAILRMRTRVLLILCAAMAAVVIGLLVQALR